MAVASSKQRLSLLEKLDILPALVSILGATFFSVITGLFRGPNGAPSYYLHVAYAILRMATRRLSTAQLQYISPSTTKAYEQYAQSARFSPQTVELGFGAKGHWIGDKNAKNVIVWYHGGGFSLPANRSAFDFWAELVKSSQSSGKDVAIFALSYTLVPEAVYPTQLIQAVEALRYILTRTNRKPSQVSLGGDSAGGNLVFGVLSHLAHPHPSIGELKLSENLAGATAIAPWTSLDEAHSQQVVDYSSDLVTPYVGILWGKNYLAGSKRDNYTDISDAPVSWFNTYPVGPILVLAGGNEILLPLITDFIDRLKAGHSSTEFFVGHREAHVAPVYNRYCLDKTETLQEKRLKQWLRDLL